MKILAGLIYLFLPLGLISIPAIYGTEIPAPEYSKTHIGEYLIIDVQSWGVEKAKSLVFFQIIVYSDKGLLAMKSEGPVDGVINSFTGDLDQDDNIETYIIAQSSGSGGYGGLYGYELRENRLETIDLEGSSSENESGYRGHDNFNIENKRLIRAFPVYKESDPDASPSGGTRRIFYKLKGDFFVIEKVVNSP